MREKWSEKRSACTRRGGASSTRNVDDRDFGPAETKAASGRLFRLRQKHGDDEENQGRGGWGHGLQRRGADAASRATSAGRARGGNLTPGSGQGGKRGVPEPARTRVARLFAAGRPGSEEMRRRLLRHAERR